MESKNVPVLAFVTICEGNVQEITIGFIHKTILPVLEIPPGELSIFTTYENYTSLFDFSMLFKNTTIEISKIYDNPNT